MARGRTTGSRTPPAAQVEPPLVKTDPAKAIALLVSQRKKIEALDPADYDAARDANGFLHSDVKKCFGPESDEYGQFWPHNIVEEKAFELRDGYDDDDDLDEGAWPKQNRMAEVKAGIAKMLPRIDRLIERARELAAMHGQKGNSVSFQGLIDDLGTAFELVKPNGDRLPYRGARDTSKGRLTVLDPDFAGEVGDTIEFAQPNGKVEICDVTEVSHVGNQLDPDFAHYTIKIRSIHARPKPAAPPVVHQNNRTNYNIMGSTIGAVGENATVASSHVIGQATQWNGADRDAIAAEISRLRKELAGAAGGDGSDAEQASEDLVHVNAANKALAANDEGAFKSAMKKLGGFGWKLFEKVTMAVTMGYLQQHGILPAAHHAALPPAGE